MARPDCFWNRTSPITPCLPSGDTNSKSHRFSITPHILLDALRQKSLRCTIDGAILWVKVAELASLELMLHVAVKDDIA